MGERNSYFTHKLNLSHAGAIEILQEMLGQDNFVEICIFYQIPLVVSWTLGLNKVPT